MSRSEDGRSSIVESANIRGANVPLVHQRPPIWRNVAVLKWLAQFAVLFVVLGLFWLLASEARENLQRRGIPAGYNWLSGPANFQLGEGIQTVDSPERRLTMSRALWVGMVNTLRVAAIGIVLSTILGVFIGVSRLSKNFIANRFASAFVEIMRNIPLLVQILFWLVILGSLAPLSADSGPIPGWLIVSQKGISIPRVFLADGFYQFATMLFALAVPLWFIRRALQRRQDTLGGNQRVTSTTVAYLSVSIVLAWFLNPVMGFLGGVLDSVASAWNAIPVQIFRGLLGALIILIAVVRIRRLLNSRRTPVGFAKLTDDDWFRMLFSAFVAVLAALVVVRFRPGITTWFVESVGSFWTFLGDKFGDGRGAQPIDAMLPTLAEGRFVNFSNTGLTMSVFFASLLFGLVFYTASFIGEVVRGGVLAVPRGQSEAALALGFTRGQMLRKVVLPQAFRVIMPPLGNQYLNITKNTSLGIAVGFSELVQVGQTVYNKNSQTLAVFGIYIGFFLLCSLSISAVVNTINRRLAIVER